jgi:ABC-type multidrug transport system fused ATPase/permease subunit
MQNFLWKEIFFAGFLLSAGWRCKAGKFYIFLHYSFYFFQHIKYIQKGGYADAGKR